jgi:hypothetical protein
MLNVVAKQVASVGSFYGFTTTAIEVYNSISITGAYQVAIKSIILDCTSPEVHSLLM